MERNLAFPVHPHYQESNVVQTDDSQPYLEAKLYMERMDQKNKVCQEEKDGTQTELAMDSSEALEHDGPLTVYPIRVPSTHFSCSATVQWDIPDTPTEDPFYSSGSVDELNSSYGVSMDWVVNPLSSDMLSLSQGEQPDLQPEDFGLTNVKLQQRPSEDIENEADFCLECDEKHLHVCVTPSNVDDNEHVKETSQTEESSHFEPVEFEEKNCDDIKSSYCIEALGIQPAPNTADVPDEEYIQKEGPAPDLLKEPEQEVANEENEICSMELNSHDCSEEVGINQSCTVLIGTTNCEDVSFTTQEPRPSDIILEQELPTESNYEQITVINNDQTLELQHTEMKMQESMLTVEQEETAYKELTDISGEVELPGHNEQLIYSTKTEQSYDQSEYSDEFKNFEQSKQTPLDHEKMSEESNHLECPNEPESSYQLCQSKCPDESELSEHLNQSECSTEIKTSLSEPKDIEQSNQPEYEQQQNGDKDNDSQREELSLGNVCEAEEQPAEEEKISESVEPVILYKNGNADKLVDREEACRLAEKLYRLENVQRTDVVQYLDKDNEFSRAVGEEYLKFFDFTDQSLDEALRSFLKEVVLIGETQERERVLEQFSNRYQQCNPDTFSSSGAVLTLTCAVMLLNTDLHGQNVGKAMSMPVFVSNLDGMNDGQNFSKDLLKAVYNSIKNHQLEWAIEEKELLNSITLEQDSDQDAFLRSKSNPFQDIAHDKKATVFHRGFLKRKAHADIDGKRTPWGKRSWKTFYAVLKGMVLYLQKDEYRKDWQSSEEVLSVHHSLAERAQDYTKRPHVFRLQTADWRVFLFEAASTEQMNLWIGRINLVSALYSAPPFPAAVGSQKKFCRPILPATQSVLTLEKQLQSHAAMLQSFYKDLSALQQGVQEGRRTKTRELEEHRHREEYLQHEICRYEAYVQVLEIWQANKTLLETADGTDLTVFDQELWKGMAVEEKEESEMDAGLKRSHSSPSLELEVATPLVVKVKRNISERRTYRKIVIPRRNKEL